MLCEIRWWWINPSSPDKMIRFGVGINPASVVVCRIFIHMKSSLCSPEIYNNVSIFQFSGRHRNQNRIFVLYALCRMNCWINHWSVQRYSTVICTSLKHLPWSRKHYIKAMKADYSKEIRSQHAHWNGMSYICIVLVQIQVGEPNKLEPPTTTTWKCSQVGPRREFFPWNDWEMFVGVQMPSVNHEHQRGTWHGD